MKVMSRRLINTFELCSDCVPGAQMSAASSGSAASLVGGPVPSMAFFRRPRSLGRQTASPTFHASTADIEQSFVCLTGWFMCMEVVSF